MHKRNASVVGPLNVEEIESSLTFIGFAGMIDPPRNEAKKAVSACIQAGIIPVMTPVTTNSQQKPLQSSWAITSGKDVSEQKWHYQKKSFQI
jgi:hypothetical protein